MWKHYGTGFLFNSRRKSPEAYKSQFDPLKLVFWSLCYSYMPIFPAFFGLKWPMSNVLSYWEVTFVFTWRNNWYRILNAFINDLSDDLKTNARLFTDDVSLFSVADQMNLPATNLSSDLSKLNARANQWKMTFNPEPNKQAQKVIFLVK